MENAKNTDRTVDKSKILDFSNAKTDSLLPIDFDCALAWWKSLSHDWKTAMMYNHNYNYGRLGSRKITDFDSVIKYVEFDNIGNQEIFFAECKAITVFICSFYDDAYFIEDLSPIYFLENIERLYCKYIKIKNIDTVGSLLNLKLAELHATDIKSLRTLSELKKLEHLAVEGTKISSLEGIEGLSKLKHLNIAMTQVSTLEPLRTLENLEYLSCLRTNISSLEPIRKLGKLKTIHCYSNQVNNLDALENLKYLENVNFSNTLVTDIIPLKNSRGLRQITIKGTRISNNNIAILKGLLPDVTIAT